MIRVRQLVPGVVAQVLDRQPLSPGKVGFAWRLAVGPQIERVTEVSLTDDRTLVVRTSDARWRREIERSWPLVRSRLERLLGADVVRTVDFRVS